MVYSRLKKWGGGVLSRMLYSRKKAPPPAIPLPPPDVDWTKQTSLPGLNMNDEAALAFLHTVVEPELESFRLRYPVNPVAGAFGLINGSYMAVDAHVYYACLKHFKPGRVIEIGIGNSTLLAASVCRETGAQLIAIDPHPAPVFLKGVAGVTRLIAGPVQSVDMNILTSLQENDILFIDSSHLMASGSDVQVLFCEVLPELKRGVLVHIHDIELPNMYPQVYYDQHLYYNEQFILQAFLAFNHRFEIIWPGNYMMVKYPEQLLKAIPEVNQMREKYPSSTPTSFWIRS